MARTLTATAPNGQIVSRKTDRPYQFAVVVKMDKAAMIARHEADAADHDANADALEVATLVFERVENPGRWDSDLVVKVAGNGHRIEQRKMMYPGDLTSNYIPAETDDELMTRAEAVRVNNIKRYRNAAKASRRAAAKIAAVPGPDYYEAASWHSRRDLCNEANGGIVVPVNEA